MHEGKELCGRHVVLRVVAATQFRVVRREGGGGEGRGGGAYEDSSEKLKTAAREAVRSGSMKRPDTPTFTYSEPGEKVRNVLKNIRTHK